MDRRFFPTEILVNDPKWHVTVRNIIHHVTCYKWQSTIEEMIKVSKPRILTIFERVLSFYLFACCGDKNRFKCRSCGLYHFHPFSGTIILTMEHPNTKDGQVIVNHRDWRTLESAEELSEDPKKIWNDLIVHPYGIFQTIGRNLVVDNWYDWTP